MAVKKQKNGLRNGKHLQYSKSILLHEFQNMNYTNECSELIIREIRASNSCNYFNHFILNTIHNSNAMKKILFKKASILSCFFLSLFLFLCVLLNMACKKTVFTGAQVSAQSSLELNQDKDDTLFRELLTQLVVWRKPGSTTADFDAWIDKLKQDGSVFISRSCESCDNSLMLLTGKGVELYIQKHTASSRREGTPQTDVSGDDGPVYNCLNFPIVFSDFPGKNLDNPVKLPIAAFSEKPVKVAVFDTGLEPGELSKSYLYQPLWASCIRGAEYGWNFINHTNNYADDHLARHGTTVTRFITDQVNKYKRNSVQILPVKVFDNSGTSDLFNILCGFAYAKERGVQMINASFGFYVPRLELLPDYKGDPNVDLLREYVRYYLTKSKILLIAAAGNYDDVNEKNAFILHALPYPVHPRNLEEVSFYPASLARDTGFPNVIAVTTVDKTTSRISPIQNYSRRVVDIGVNRDAILPVDRFVFFNPRFTSQTVEGSSFAAPIVTGKICANYYKIQSILTGPSYTKADIWNALISETFLYPGLAHNIKKGRVMFK